MQHFAIGLAGMGNVGAGVFKHLTQNRALLRERLGFELDVKKIALRDINKNRGVDFPTGIVTTRWQDILDDPEIRIVVELMGQKEESLRFMLGAIERGKTVVTGNKALLAEHGREIFDAATKHKVPVFFEAAVAGGIPIIKAIREAFIGNHIRSIHGIINGTSNYILTQMTEREISFTEALAEAQAQGYAEADPTLDVNGWDAAHKAVILASLAYGFWVPTDKIFVEGIDQITAGDIRFAKKLGYAIKLLGIIKADENGEIEVRVHPTLIPEKHVLASVNGVFNALAVHGDVVGETLFYGRGAGQDPTTSSVIADLAEAAAALQSPRSNYGFMPHGLYGTCKPIDQIVCEYYLRLTVEDRPGVVAQVAGVLGALNIGISSLFQPEGTEGEAVPLVFVIHKATSAQIQNALDQIGALPCVKKAPRMIRVENFA
ncbi:Homoserine dehydrogenase [Chthoniobacter flavus Ellin428]|uniref:Homoserine dehydrogenase n=1 Tax=Chthoniobacter flavus Ellin428 TaxID=497964 RepID=B4CYG1_9BACT|nr:homoserine dehydrogenase [Chthoniobacter flavus]EDY20502.1 Homoserine dehydrogenase [Chthoniobacter flavus Ellin428]TCO85557.1 homoserine dehydrogenase [Chthoniobacter flavus]